MASLTLKIPDSLLANVKAALRTNSTEAVREHLLSMLEAISQEDEPLDRETEKKLVQGLKSPKIEVTEAYWDSKLRHYNQRHLKRKRA